MGDSERAGTDPIKYAKENPPNELVDDAEDHKYSTNSQSLEEKDTNEHSFDSCSDDPSQCFPKDTISDSILEPYPYGTNGEMVFENLRVKMKDLPRFIIDFMGKNMVFGCLL